MNPFVNAVNFQMKLDESVSSTDIDYSTQEGIAPGTLLFDNLLTEQESQDILNSLETVDWQPVSITGMKGNYTPGDVIGSWRASNFNPDFAEKLWERLRPFVEVERTMSELTPTDFDGHLQWKAVGINPLLRFIRYTDGGMLVPHYDAPFIADEKTRTLVSVVIYLDNDPNIAGGQTRFLFDPQVNVPVSQRNLEDRLEIADEDEVRIAITPKAGGALVFDHRIFHDSAPVTGTGRKTIIRTDILFEKA